MSTTEAGHRAAGARPAWMCAAGEMCRSDLDVPQDATFDAELRCMAPPYDAVLLPRRSRTVTSILRAGENRGGAAAVPVRTAAHSRILLNTTVPSSPDAVAPHTTQAVSSALPFNHSRTSTKLHSFPTLSNNRHHTSSNPWLMTKLTVRYTVHGGRRFQGLHFHLTHPQDWQWPRLSGWCWRSRIATTASSRTI